MLHQWQQYKLKNLFEERENKEKHLTLNGCNPRPDHQQNDEAGEGKKCKYFDHFVHDDEKKCPKITFGAQTL